MHQVNITTLTGIVPRRVNRQATTPGPSGLTAHGRPPPDQGGLRRMA